MESRIQVPLEKTGIRHPESRIHGMGSRIQDCLVFANMGRYFWTVNGALLFSLYLPSTDQEPTFEDFVNEILIRRFLPFTDCFFLLRVVSFCFHAPRDSPESQATFVSQPVNREEVWIRHCRRFPYHEQFSRSRPLHSFYVFSRLTSC